MRFRFVLDEPQVDDAARVAVHSRLVIGRFACRRRAEDPRVVLVAESGDSVEFAVEEIDAESSDFLEGGRNWSTWRFSGLVRTGAAWNRPPVRIRFEYGLEVEQVDIPWRTFTDEEMRRFIATKDALIRRVRPLLRCCRIHNGHSPCGAVFEGLVELTCSGCGARAEIVDGCITFGTQAEQGRNVFHGRNDLPGSFFGDPRTINEVSRLRDGMVLDVGSGWRYHYESNVVHFDTIRFPTTDVLADGGVLPFADESFDAVFSFSVLEHVKDPARVVSEMKRVVKRGGVIQISAPHLIQYHGHPDHYFNPTFRGLRHLLGDGVDIEIDETPVWGHPVWGLVEILRDWLAALPPEAAREFANATVAELTSPATSLFERRFVRELDLAKARGIATNNFIVARRTY